MRLLRPDILNVSTARFRAVHTAVSAGPCPAWPCVPSLFCAPGMGLAAMPVFLFRRVGGALSGPVLCAQPYFSATGKCACSVSSMPFRRVHPSSIGIQSDAALLFAAFFCSAPRSFPPGWKRAPPQPSAIKKSPFRALFLCIYQRALPSRTSTCVNEAYLPTPPLGFRRLAMS